MSRPGAKKIRPGRYEYRGLILQCHGYYPPDKRIVWEAIDPETGEGCYHEFSKAALMAAIDQFETK